MVSTAALVLAWAVTASGAADPLAACRSIAEDTARLGCYDTLADHPVAGARSPVPAADEAMLPPSPEALFGRDAVQSEVIVRQAAGIERIEEIRGGIAEVRLDPHGKLVLTLDNGQVWSQIDSPAPRLKAGDEVRIRRAAIKRDGGAA